MIAGARTTGSGSTAFSVWAPEARRVRIVAPDSTTICELSTQPDGWFSDTCDVDDGTRYYVQLDDGPLRPDPASIHQPEGVHGPSEVVDLTFDWNDHGWAGRSMREQIVYEIHIGTFTDAGTFDAAIERLDHLVDLGVTTVELMPVAQCPGERNWGYDGVGLYATQASYGGPRGLQRLVDACHRRGLSVWLDVVYNHLGPEGNYLPEFGPYFTDRHHTPWGPAVNLDGPRSEHVRRFFIDNARMWATDFHVDGFRLDAVHSLVDASEPTFLEQLGAELHDLADELGRPLHVIAENALNDPVMLLDRGEDGMGLDAGWNDDFHHALHVAFTGESARYYAEFQDAAADLTTAIRDGYVLGGGTLPYRGGRQGSIVTDLPRTSLIVFSQNHDQIGNRGEGDRLTTLASPAAIRLAAGIVILSPWIPMLFMGEEWGETRPFLYFVDHGDADLREAVRRGRNEEFAGFITGDVPDPASPSTRDRSVLDWAKPDRPPHDAILALYRRLIHVRSQYDSITDPDPSNHDVVRRGAVITLTNRGNGAATHAVFNVGSAPARVEHRHHGWKRIVDGAEPDFGGDGPTTPAVLDTDDIEIGPWGFVMYREETN